MGTFLIGTIPPAVGATLFYEGFDYAESSTLGGQGGWTANSGNLTVDSNSLTFGGLQTSGRSVGTNSGTNSLNIDTGLTTPTGGVRWVSFLMIQTNGITDWQAQQVTLGDTSGNQMILAGNPGVISPNSQIMGTGGSYGFFNAGIAETFNTGATSTTTSATFFALKYDYDASEISFFYNPTPGATEGSLLALGSINAVDNNLAAVHMNLGRIQLLTANISAGSVSFDEFRIGESWADVSPIPEPSTALLLSFCGLLCFLKRRNKAF